MQLLKIIDLQNKITLKLSEGSSRNVLFFFNSTKKLILKVTFNKTFFLEGKSLIIFGNSSYIDYSNYIKLITKSLNLFVYNQYSYFSKLHMIGLGFKNFILGKYLYILVGDCNYIMFRIPDSIKVFCKKNQVFILGENSTETFNFMSHVKRVKKSNFYKGKGILQFKNFKFTKLKVGKKQRFM
jgi:hypothetical protein